MTIEGATRPEILTAIGKSATYVRNLLQGKGLSVHLNTNPRRAMKYLSEMAKIVSDKTHENYNGSLYQKEKRNQGT